MKEDKDNVLINNNVNVNYYKEQNLNNHEPACPICGDFPCGCFSNYDENIDDEDIDK